MFKIKSFQYNSNRVTNAVRSLWNSQKFNIKLWDIAYISGHICGLSERVFTEIPTCFAGVVGKNIQHVKYCYQCLNGNFKLNINFINGSPKYQIIEMNYLLVVYFEFLINNDLLEFAKVFGYKFIKFQHSYYKLCIMTT